MKITDITIYNAPGVFYVRVDTDEGISGYGECSCKGVPALKPLVLSIIKPQIIGLSPFDIEKIEQLVMVKNYKISGQLLAIAFSGVEIALWDIKGKITQQPVYNLLGGLYRETLEFYGSSMSRDLSPQDEARKVLDAIERYGFQAVKMKVGPRMGTGDPVDLHQDVERVKVMREAIGPQVKLMIDGNSSYTYAQAVQLFEKIKQYDIFHFEEACPYYDIEAYVKLAQLPVPIHVGEQDWNLMTFRDFISRGACDLYAADLMKCGGFSNARRAATLCRAFGITYAPHNTTRGIGLAATMHLAASMPECSYYLEWKIGGDAAETLLTRPVQIENGRAQVPAGVGLGLELDIEKMSREMDILS